VKEIRQLGYNPPNHQTGSNIRKIWLKTAILGTARRSRRAVADRDAPVLLDEAGCHKIDFCDRLVTFEGALRRVD
jgi:hypothetical protein